MILEFRTYSPEREVVLSDKRTSISLAYDGVPIDYYDRQGRLVGMQVGERHYRRGLDNRLLEKFRLDGGRTRIRRDLLGPDKGCLIDAAYGRARQVAEQIRTGNVALARMRNVETDDVWGAALGLLDPITRYDYARLEAERRQFRSVYAPVSILPPDQYMSLVVQMTVGCSYNRCTFCDFYRMRRFSIKSPDELRQHIRAVLRFFGESATLRKSVFLADGNALVIPQKKLMERIAVVHEFFAFVPPDIEDRRRRSEWCKAHPGSFEGIYSFLDAFSTLRKSVADFEKLREHHLRRVYIGLESGDDELLRFIRKPGDAATMVQAVRTIKAAGLNVGVIAMVGVGGRKFAERHVRKTVEVVNAMGLGARDIFYLSDFVNHPGLPYERLAREGGIRDLSYEEVKAQREAIRNGLSWQDPAHPPKVALYDIREFVY